MKPSQALPEKSPFASANLVEHLLRGVVGMTAIGWAIDIAQTQPWSSLALGALALIAFRGCPICWSIGLVETAWRQWRSR